MNILRYLPRFREAYRSLQALAQRESWSRGEVEAFQLERLNAVWGQAVAHVPYYRRLRVQAGLPAKFTSLAEFQAGVPVLTKSTVRTRHRDFLSERAPRGFWERTGGSTSHPMNTFWGSAAHREVLRFRYRFHAAWGLDIFDRAAYLWGHGASFAPGLPGYLARLRRPVEDRLRSRLRLSAYTLGRADLRAYLRRIAAFRPAYLYGYSRAVYLLALEAEAAGFLCDALQLVILTAEPAFPHIIATADRAFGVPAVVEYGSVECGFLAGEQPDRTLRVREDGVILETRPRPDGSHEILVTVLTNPAFPLLRYEIGDVTDAPLERPARGFAVLKNISGRSNDLVLSRSGRYLHWGRFADAFMFEAKGIRHYSLHQQADGTLRVAVEVSNPAAPPDTTRLRRTLAELVEGYPVTIDVVNVIPQTVGGKHRLITSDLADHLAAG